MDYVIPCEVFARLATVLDNGRDDLTEWFKAVRIENGIAICTNRRMMAIENINASDGIIHIIADPALVAQCKTEAAFSSTLTITVNELLKYAVAKTTLGYIHPGNCCVWSDQPNDFDKWRSVIDRCRQPAAEPKGVMFWDAIDIANLAKSSPSGGITFESVIDASRPTILRDILDPNWVGIFLPSDAETNYASATLPSWI